MSASVTIAMTPAERAAAERRPCPTCRAGRGEPCINIASGFALDGVHAMRMTLDRAK